MEPIDPETTPDGATTSPPDERPAPAPTEGARLESAEATALAPAEATAPAPRPPAPAGPERPRKSPAAALLLSFMPGIGQVYNGQPAKALVFFFGVVGCIWGTAEVGPFPFAFLIPFLYFFNLVDAYRSAALVNERAAGGRVTEEETVESPVWGGSLIVLGLALLLDNLGWIDLAALHRYWPLLLIAAGAGFVWSSLRHGRE